MKKITTTAMCASLLTAGALGLCSNEPVYADVAVGDAIVTLGEDLTVSQKNKVLEEMGVSEKDVQIVYVTNDEEHQYLGSFIPASQIGSKAISSAKIVYGAKNSGLVVESNNISFISNEMYLNALSTAGLTDAKVFVTAPFEVSGTGALTGIFKAYEEATGEKIDEDQKLLANEEMVTTMELADETGVSQKEASDFVAAVKEALSKEEPKTQEGVQVIVNQVAQQQGIALSNELNDKFVGLFDQIKDLKIDWEKVNATFEQAKEKWNAFAESEEGKNLIDSIKHFFVSIWEGIKAFFTSLFGN